MPLEFDGVNGIIKNTTSDGDVTIKGNDGGSEISALTFDMSAEGAATFNSTIAMTSFAATDGCTITTADNDPQLTLVSTDADADEGPRMNFLRNSGSPANNDVLARISLQGKDAGNNTTMYAQLETTAVNVAEGSETGKFNIQAAVAGSINQDVITMTGSEVVINDSSNDLDFRVESNGNAHMLFVDGGNNRVGIGTTPDLGVGLHIRTGDSSGSVEASKDELVIENSANAGITILSGASSQGAIAFGDSGDNDIGRITYAHSDNSLRFHTNASEVLRILSDGKIGIGTDSPAKLLSLKKDGGGGAIGIDIHNQGTNAADDALITFETQGHRNYSMGIDRSASSFVVMSEADGLGTARLTIDDSGDAIFSGTVGVPALDIMSGSSIHGTITTSSSSLTLNARNTGIMLFQSGGTERMRIGSDGATTINVSGNENTLTLSSTDADANPGPVLNYYRNSGSAADNDYIGRNIFTFNNDAPEIETALAQNVIMTDVSNGSEDVKYIHEQMTAGSIVDRFSISATEAVFNEGSIDSDFRVEGDGDANALFVEGETSYVGIGTNDPNHKLTISGGTNTGLQICGNNTGTGQNDGFKIYTRDDNNGTEIVQLENSFLTFHTNGTERMRILAGGGLTFNGDTAAANALDDYEEGTWTAAIKDASNNAVTMGDAAGSYTKVGRLVFVSGYFRVNGLGSASGNVRITGLPFAVPNNNDAYASVSIGYAANLNNSAVYVMAGYTGKNTSDLILQNWDATHSTSSLQASELSTDGEFILSCSYYTA